MCIAVHSSNGLRVSSLCKSANSFATRRRRTSIASRDDFDSRPVTNSISSSGPSKRVRKYSFCAWALKNSWNGPRSEEHTSELQSRLHLVCRLLLEKKNKV